MRSRAATLSLMLFSSVLSNAQTASCTNWQRFTLDPSLNASQTVPLAIARWGTVVGYAQDAASCCTQFGFIRFPDGNVSTYQFPGSNRTNFTKRNSLGVTVGFYQANNDHGLVLYGSKVVTVDHPGPGDTILTGINYWGTLIGIYSPYSDFSTPYDGFKLKKGVFTVIHYPNSVTTNPTGINSKGMIVGWYQNRGYKQFHGFTLLNGVYKTLDHPKAKYGTFLNDVNPYGVIAGQYADSAFQGHGFIYVNGVFKDVNAPNFQVANVSGINRFGYVTGYSSIGEGFTAHCQ